MIFPFLRKLCFPVPSSYNSILSSSVLSFPFPLSFFSSSSPSHFLFSCSEHLVSFHIYLAQKENETKLE